MEWSSARNFAHERFQDDDAQSTAYVNTQYPNDRVNGLQEFSVNLGGHVDTLTTSPCKPSAAG